MINAVLNVYPSLRVVKSWNSTCPRIWIPFENLQRPPGTRGGTITFQIFIYRVWRYRGKYLFEIILTIVETAIDVLHACTCMCIYFCSSQLTWNRKIKISLQNHRRISWRIKYWNQIVVDTTKYNIASEVCIGRDRSRRNSTRISTKIGRSDGGGENVNYASGLPAWPIEIGLPSNFNKEGVNRMTRGSINVFSFVRV